MQIHWAAKPGDSAAIQRQLARGVPVDSDDAEGKTPLMYAAASAQADAAIVRLLAEAGANVNAVSTALQETTLGLAARCGDLAKVRLLLELGADPRFVNSSGYTAITNLTACGDAEYRQVLELLLQQGTDPDTITKYGECPLRTAIRCGHFDAVDLLLRHGASPAPARFTDLMWAVALGTVEDVARELHRGADLTVRDSWEITPWLLSLLTRDLAKARLLLGAGAERDARGRCGQTNLMHSVLRNHIEMTRWLIRLGADPAVTDEFGRTALEVAAESGAADCIEVLLAAGGPFSPNSPNAVAALTGAANPRVVSVLAAAGVNLNAVGADGYHVLKSAIEAGDIDFVRALLEMGACVDTTSTGDTALHTAVSWDHLEIARLLLKAGADPNAQDVDGCTPLMFARSLECAELLLSAGADVHLADQVGAQAVHYQSDPEILDRLLQAGACLNPDDPSCGTPLHRAAEDGNVELTRYLLEKGARVDARTSWGLTPLMSAAERGHGDVLRLLLSAGADVRAQDQDGRTALFYAAAPEAFTAAQLAMEPSEMEWPESGDADPEMADLLRKTREQMAEIGIPEPALEFGYRPSDDTTALEILVKAGADLEATDYQGLCPLLLAVKCGRPARVAALVRLGASLSARDSEGRSTIELAREHPDSDQQAQITRILNEGT